MITVAQLHQLLRLDPETGRLFWRERGPEWFKAGRLGATIEAALWNAKHAGKEALAVRLSKGYRGGKLLNRAHRRGAVIFAMVHGQWASPNVDHVDRDVSNDRPSNLREASLIENARNRLHPKVSGKISSQYRGVTWAANVGKWRAQCHGNGRRHLGLFDREIDAAVAYDRAAAERHGAFAVRNFS